MAVSNASFTGSLLSVLLMISILCLLSLRRSAFNHVPSSGHATRHANRRSEISPVGADHAGGFKELVHTIPPQSVASPTIRQGNRRFPGNRAEELSVFRVTARAPEILRVSMIADALWRAFAYLSSKHDQPQTQYLPALLVLNWHHLGMHGSPRRERGK